MVTTTAGVAAIIVILTAGVSATVDAAGVESVVVLHLNDFAHVSPGDLVEAKRQVASVYRAAGVRTVWTDGSARTAPADDAFHVDVALLSEEMVARKCRLDAIGEQVLGRASPPISRAFVFYDRLAGHAMLTGSSVALLLGMVIAHEVGHVLLPALSHSRSGIMRDTHEGRIARMPFFTGDQATTMRTLLDAAGGH